MASDASGQPAYVVSSERLTLTLALPFMLLLAASLAAWPWRAFGLPVAGTLAPPSIFLLALTVAASMYAIRRKLPMGMITWVPAGQGAIVLLGVGFLPPQTDETFALVALLVYGLVFLLALGIAVAIAAHGTYLAVAFVAFFAMTEAARFPIFEAQAAVPVAGAPFFTLAAALRAALELSVLVWLACRLVTVPPEQGKRITLAIVGLTLIHGLLAGWEDPVLLGELSLLQVLERAGRWLLQVTVLLGMVTVLARLRNSWPRQVEQPGESERVRE